MTTEEYRNHPALNFSSAKHLLKSPAEYMCKIIEEKAEPTRQMIIGTCLHAMVLENKNIDDVCHTKPNGLSLATKEGKAWKELHDSLPILSFGDGLCLCVMRRYVFENEFANDILRYCKHRETPMFAEFEGVEIKGMIDAHGVNAGMSEIVMCDIKTTDDPSPQAFAKTVIERDYDMQAAWYLELAAQNLARDIEDAFFYWIVVQNKAPFSCVVYDGNEFLSVGRSKMERAISTFKQCREANKWPHPHQGVNTLKAPQWYVEKHMTQTA